ncbi:riboflavin kinase [Tyrophagus putrescentiae]|nr:riboflavin kinase [Tyrophagus putrescentiae]
MRRNWSIGAKPVYVESKVVKGSSGGKLKEKNYPKNIATANLEDKVAEELVDRDGLNYLQGVYYGFAQLVFPHNFSGEEISSSGDSTESSLKCEAKVSLSPNCALSSETSSSLHQAAVFTPVYPMICILGWRPCPVYNDGHYQRSAEVHFLHDFGYNFVGSHIRAAIIGLIRPPMDVFDRESAEEMYKSDIEATLKGTANELDILYGPFFLTKKKKKICSAPAVTGDNDTSKDGENGDRKRSTKCHII